MTLPNPGIAEIKAGLKTVWTSGDYGQIARGLEPGAMTFLERIAIEPGDRVLDVACGTGQLAIPAARAGAEVTGIDISAAWIEQARARARGEGLDITFDVGDAEEMPYGDDAFDVVVSLIGVMFAPRPERAVSELFRVTRPGGRIVMGNWTAEGFVGEFFRTVSGYAPPPDMPSPLLWGDEATVRERLSGGASEVRCARADYRIAYPMAPREVAGHYFEHFGPMRQTVAKLDAGAREALRADIERLFADANEGPEGTTQVTAEILEVSAVVA